MRKLSLLCALALPALLLPLASSGQESGERKFPRVCEELLDSRRTHLAGIWGSFALKHQEPIHRLDVTPDGKRALTVNSLGILTLWDLATGERIWSRPDRPNGDAQVTIVAFTPDQKRLLTVNWSSELWVRDLETGEPLARRVMRGYPMSVDVSPDSKRALTTGDHGALELWDIEKDEHIKTIEGEHDEALTATFAPDGTHALVCGRTWTKLFDLETGKETKDLELGGGWNARFLADGQHVLMPMAQGYRVFGIDDPPDAEAIIGKGRFLALSQNGKRILVEDEKGIALRDPLKEDDIAVIKPAEPDAPVDPDQQQVIFGGRGGGGIMWRGARPQQARGFQGFQAQLAMNGRRAVIVEPSGKISLYDIGKDEQTYVFEKEMIPSALVYSPDGKYVFSAGTDGIKQRDALTGDEVATITTDARGVESLAVSSDGTVVASGSEGVKVFRRAPTPEIQGVAVGQWGEIDEQAGECHGVAFLTSSTFVQGIKGGLTVRDSATGDTRAMICDQMTPVALAVSPDGKRVFTVGAEEGTPQQDGQSLYSAPIHRIDLATRESETLASDPNPASTGDDSNTQVVIGPGGRVVRWRFGRGRGWMASPASSPRRLGVTPDGKRLVVANITAISLFDVETKERIFRNEEILSCSQLAVSPDGKLAAIGTHRSEIYLVSLQDGQEADFLDLEGVSHGIPALAFSPDGKTLLVGTTMGPVLRFRMKDEPAKVEKRKKGSK